VRVDPGWGPGSVSGADGGQEPLRVPCCGDLRHCWVAGLGGLVGVLAPRLVRYVAWRCSIERSYPASRCRAAAQRPGSPRTVWSPSHPCSPPLAVGRRSGITNPPCPWRTPRRDRDNPQLRRTRRRLPRHGPLHLNLRARDGDFGYSGLTTPPVVNVPTSPQPTYNTDPPLPAGTILQPGDLPITLLSSR
jgi:hypothetical protein